MPGCSEGEEGLRARLVNGRRCAAAELRSITTKTELRSILENYPTKIVFSAFIYIVRFSQGTEALLDCNKCLNVYMRVSLETIAGTRLQFSFLERKCPAE